MKLARTTIGGTPIELEDPRRRTRWQAKWLRDPVFEAPPQNLWAGKGIGVSENTSWGMRKRVNVSRKMGRIIR